MTLRVHYHTDNHFFSGSEVVLTSLLRWAGSDPDIIPSLSYRRSAGSDSAIQAHLPQGIDALPLCMPDPTDLAERWKGRPLLWLLTRSLLEIAALAKLFFIYDVIRLHHCFEHSRPDVVHVNNGGFPGAISCNAAVVAARWAGVPAVIYVVHNLAMPRRGLRRLTDWPVDRIVARWVTRFVTGSRSSAEQLRRVLSLGTERVLVFPHGVEARAPRPEGPAPLPRIPAGVATLLVVARLEQRKGHRILFEAIAELIKDGREPLVLVAGEGPERAALDEEILRLDLSETVYMIGQREDVPELLNLCDILVLPSIGQEDTPLVIFEAMAASRSVVATSVAGIPEQVVDEETGLIVPPGTVAELVIALRTLIDDPERRRAYGRAGLERFRSFFSIETSVKRYMQLYRQLMYTSVPCR